LNVLFMSLMTVLIFYDYRLALFLLLIYALLNILTERKSRFIGGTILTKSKAGLIASFDKSIQKTGNMLPAIHKGFRAFPRLLSTAQLIEWGLTIKSTVARKEGKHRRYRGTGRTISYRLPRSCSISNGIHWSATIRAAVKKGSLKVVWDDIRERMLQGRGKLSIIVILDSSASMIYSIRQLHKTLNAIKRKVLKHRDRISLISCKGFGAITVLKPTTSVNLFLQRLKSIGLSDYTPLATGIYLGLKLAIHERRRGYIPLLVIVSDGNVNIGLNVPIPQKFKVYHIERAVGDTLSVAKLIAENKIQTVVINTRHRDDSLHSGEICTGTDLMIALAKITNGIYVAVRD